MSNLTTAQLAIYAALTLPACFILIKHGKPGLMGWFYLIAFFGLRIVGGGLALSGSSSASIVGNIGLSPLLLAAAGILHEARNYRCQDLDAKVEWLKVLVFHFVVTGGVAMLAAGSSGLQSEDPTKTDATLVKVGIAILTASWAIVTIWAVLSLCRAAKVHTASTRLGTMLIHSVLLSGVFIGIRVIYTLVALTSNKPHLNPATGSLAVRVVLAFLPELLTALGFLAAGLRTRDICNTSRPETADTDGNGNGPESQTRPLRLTTAKGGRQEHV